MVFPKDLPGLALQILSRMEPEELARRLSEVLPKVPDEQLQTMSQAVAREIRRRKEGRPSLAPYRRVE